MTTYLAISYVAIFILGLLCGVAIVSLGSFVLWLFSKGS